MCSTPKMPETEEEPKEIATPTMADAQVSKTTNNTRNKAAALAGRDIKTSARGIKDEAETKKKTLLGE